MLEVLPAEKLLEHCREVAAKIAKNGPLAIAQAKRAIEAGADLPLSAANELERQVFGALFSSDDMKEGTRAFLEKRPASFKGS